MTAARTYLAGIKERAAAATAGPWDHEPFDESFGIYSLEQRDNGDFPAVLGYYASENEGATEADAEFIAAARTDLPRVTDALLAVLELHARDTYGECRRCTFGPGVYFKYPCPTVAAITEALEGK